MRHRLRGRKLGRSHSHRKAMLKNMAASFIRTVVADADENFGDAKVPGRIVTTVPKAKELRPFVEKLVTMGKKGAQLAAAAAEYGTDAERGSDAWKQWREGDGWQKWNQAMAPSLAIRRRAFAMLRDNEAVDILFNELAERFADRDGGYTRIVRLPKPRLGDAGEQAFIEFVGENDRENVSAAPAPMKVASSQPEAAAESEDESAEASDSDAGDETVAGEGAEASEEATASAEDEAKSES